MPEKPRNRDKQKNKGALPEKKVPDAGKSLNGLLMNRRTALGAIVAGAVLGTWFLSDNENTAPEKPKSFPKTLDIQGIKVRLDASWNSYPTPAGKTVEGLLQSEFQNIHIFYQSLGIDLAGKEFAFSYDPNLKGKGLTVYSMRNYSSGNVNNNEFDELGNMKSMLAFMKDVTPQPMQIKLKFIKGATIAHEIFHVLHGPHLYTSTLWAEGLAEGLGKIFEKRFPESNIIHNSNRQMTAEVERADALAREFYDNPEVQSYLSQQGLDENWILQEPNQFPTLSTTLPRDVAGLRWEIFLTDHPDFIRKFLNKLEEVNIKYQEQATGDKDFVFQGNSRQLEGIGHLAAPEYFWNWMKNERVFQRGRDGEKIMLAFSHSRVRHLTVISGRWVNEVVNSSIFKGFGITIARISPRSFTIILNSGQEIFVSSPEIFSGLRLEKDIRMEDIRSLRDFEGAEIPIIR